MASNSLTPDELLELVRAAQAGDQSAFAALVEATYADAYTLAYRLTANEEDARDVVQEAYLRAYRSLDKFRGNARFSTWLYRITANCASSHLGKRTRHRHDELTDDVPVTDDRRESDPEIRAGDAALRAELGRELAGLAPKLRSVIVLRDIYDLSHEDIATELDISVAAAKVRLHRARRQLRERLHPLRGEEQAHAV